MLSPIMDEAEHSAHRTMAEAALAALREAARRRGDVRRAVQAHAAFHRALYESARSAWLLRLIGPVWDSCERHRPALLSAGALQDRHETFDRELLAGCSAHEPERAVGILHAHLDLTTELYAIELRGRSVFAFGARDAALVPWSGAARPRDNRET